MAGIIDIIDNIQDSANVLIDIPLRNGQRKRLKSIYKKTQPPRIKLIFPPKSLPKKEEIDRQKSCRLSIKNPDAEITLAANLQNLESDRILHLIARAPIEPESLREYFRVTFRSSITVSYHPGNRETHSHPWEIHGETIDLSGSGVLTLLPKNPINKNHIRLEISVADSSDPIIGMAHLVRAKRLRKARYQVAFQFDKIDPKTQDQIIAFCMQQQRKQLRDNIKIG